MFSSEFSEICKNTFFTKHLQKIAFKIILVRLTLETFKIFKNSFGLLFRFILILKPTIFYLIHLYFCLSFFHPNFDMTTQVTQLFIHDFPTIMQGKPFPKNSPNMSDFKINIFLSCDVLKVQE